MLLQKLFQTICSLELTYFGFESRLTRTTHFDNDTLICLSQSLVEIGNIQFRGCQISMQGPQLCAKPRHFCKLDVATSKMAFLDLNLHVLQVATSNSNN